MAVARSASCIGAPCCGWQGQTVIFDKGEVLLPEFGRVEVRMSGNLTASQRVYVAIHSTLNNP